MGLPNNVLSAQIEVAPFIPPRDILFSGIMDYELGGIGLNNPSQGLQYQVWTAFVDSQSAGHVYLMAPNTPPTLFTTLPGISELSLTFDQNMAPFLAYVQAGQAKFYWYDVTVPGYVTTTLPAGSVNPKASLDDKRPQSIALGITDIILCYIYNNGLQMLRQRDRYGVVYNLLAPLSNFLISPGIITDGMNEVNRFQIYLDGAFT